ncbi:thioredoxin domain-containing protein [Lactiplantibacillus daowaiensis]|uniref:Thioredoxin domain-containing protein n=1 Tax=Lactiplantibacillus daowaiensis TaxID=2559918 RepID=A0ABW1RZL7_9LACO|nr:thioredoxin domain-containing protein [Lactiplantibacillus daowaiensis]
MNFNLDDQYTLNFGNSAAPHDLIAILNLGCVDTQAWWLPNEADLFAAIDNGQLKAHFKFWNKQKSTLVNGNIANGYLDYQHPAQAMAWAKQVFHNQQALRDSTDVPSYLATTYPAVKPYAQADAVKKQIDAEVLANQITSVPTIIFDGHAADEENLQSIKQLLA